jgi:hypothetical protein
MVKTFFNVLKIALLIFFISGALIVVFDLLGIINTSVIVSVLELVGDISLNISIFFTGYPNFWIFASYFIFKDIIILIIDLFKKGKNKK